MCIPMLCSNGCKTPPEAESHAPQASSRRQASATHVHTISMRGVCLEQFGVC